MGEETGLGVIKGDGAVLVATLEGATASTCGSAGRDSRLASSGRLGRSELSGTGVVCSDASVAELAGLAGGRASMG